MKNTNKFAYMTCFGALLILASCASSYQDRMDALTPPDAAPSEAADDDGLMSRDDMLLSGACIINADCASTEFCELGRCTSECGVDKECPDGLNCSARGKCVSDASYVDYDPIIKVAPPIDWYVDEHVISLNPDERSGSFNVKVDGGGALKYRIQVEPADARDFITISAPEGIIGSGGTRNISVGIDRDAFGSGDHLVSVSVISDAGQQNVLCEFSNGLTGRYAGFVEYANPGLGRIPIVIDLKVDSDGSIVGRTVEAGSLLYPDERTITGQYIKAEGQLYFGMIDVVDPTLERDPFGRSIGREINFMGAPSKHGVIEGEMEEVISGLLPGAINVTGSFYLTRTDVNVPEFALYDSGVMPDFYDTYDDALPSGYATCGGVTTTCNAANFPYNMIYCSNEIRSRAFKLGDNFVGVNESGEDYVNFGIVEECSADVAGSGASSCVDLELLTCLRRNQQYYLANAVASDNEYGAYFKDLNGMQRLHAFIGNDKLVNAYRVMIENVSSPLTLELTRLDGALASYERAEREFFGVNNIAVVFAASSGIVSSDDYELFRVPLQYIRASHAALQRSVSLSVRKSMASALLKDDLRRRAQNYARIVYLEGVALARLVMNHGGSFMYELAQIADELRSMSITAGNLEANLNPLGFSADYVPFLGSVDGQSSTSNFHRLITMAETSVGSAVDYATAADSEAVELKVRTEDIQERITTIEQNYELQMVQLCGSADVELLGECGLNGGEVAEMFNQIEQQYLEIEKQYQGFIDLSEMLKIKNDTARQIAGIKEHTLRFLSSSGAVLEATDIAEGEIRAAMLRSSGLFGSIGGFFSGMASLAGGLAEGAINNWDGTGIGSIAGGASGLVSAGFSAAASANSASMAQKLAKVAAQKRHVQNQQQLRLYEEGMEIAAIEAAAEVKMLLVQMAQMNLDLELAHLRLDQYVARVMTLLARVDYLMHQREVLLAQASESVNNPFSNLSFRLKRDHSVLMAVNKFEEALEDVYLAARGLEYELNVDLTQIETQLFQANSAQQLRDFKNCLEGWYYDYAIAFGSPHEEVTQLSLREDVLGFTEPVVDEVTGEVVRPEEIFRRVILNPKYISQSGAIEYPFVTTIAGGNKLFSSLVCNDRIKSIRVMLVGDFLGDNEAKVQLMQEGDSYLRDCSANPTIGEDILNTYHLDKKKATIPAGVNSFGLSAPDSTLEGISVASDRWVLIVPAGDEEPANRDIDFLNIDDIVIEITHEARTLNGTASTSVFGQCSI